MITDLSALFSRSGSPSLSSYSSPSSSSSVLSPSSSSSSQSSSTSSRVLFSFTPPSVPSISLLSRSGTEESAPSVYHANLGLKKKVSSYAGVRGLHRDEWPMPVEGWRCKHFGSVLWQGV